MIFTEGGISVDVASLAQLVKQGESALKNFYKKGQAYLMSFGSRPSSF